MKILSPAIEQLIQAFCCLPGVGPKSAQRMAFHLLQRNRDSGQLLTKHLSSALNNVGHCQQCRILCETELCPICSHPKRNPNMLCVVESPADVVAIEQTSSYFGRYFVLMGHLSPLDGIGPHDLGLPKLAQRLPEENIEEIIIATNPTTEGEATAHYIADMVKPYHIKVSRIAYGVPIGGELEYIDGNTLAHAFAGRSDLVTQE